MPRSRSRVEGWWHLLLYLLRELQLLRLEVEERLELEEEQRLEVEERRV